MSYLLDALKKAEQERKQGEQSELPLYTEPEVRATLPLWLVVLVVAVLVLTVAKVFIAGDPNQSEQIGVTKSSISDEHAYEEGLSESDIAGAKVLESGSAVPANDSPENSYDMVKSEPKDLSELSAGTLAKIPSLSLESHIYSPAAEYRSVVINGQSYNEGALLSAGVVLNEISQTGIIIKVGEQYVVLPKGISWVSTKHAK